MIYIVTSGDYSDYGIDAIFQSKDKANAYCSCHPDAKIEEWKFFDNNIYTPFNVVNINMNIYPNNTQRILFNFQTLSKEDAKFYLVNKDNVSVYSTGHIDVHLIRILPEKYNEENIKNKYTKVFYDLMPEIKYLISDIGLSNDIMKNNYDQLKYASKLVENFIAGKFGIETESV